ncbi:MAG: YdbL family protein [Robiginitomaculum sp.]
MKMTKKITAAVLALGLLSTGTVVSTVYAYAPIARAQTMDAKTIDAKSIIVQAKSKGQVGEKIDGYLGLVNLSAPASVKTAVNEINIRRKTTYTKLARKKNISVADTAGVFGELLIAKAKFGEMIKGNNGQWRKVR